MSKLFRSTGLLAISICLYSVTGFAQQDQAALPPVADTEETAAEAPAEQEVEVNEDNYRQFMELKDPMQQRSILPEDSYQSRAGLQKLDKLPEDSQKHLRNQLREIILQGDEWKPGDEEQDYPYVPSVAATNNPSLQRQEAEAWGELVDGYHAREAEIYENSSRSAAAAAAASGAPGAAGGNSEGTGADGKGQDGAGQGGAAEQAGQPGSTDAATTADSYSPNSQNDPGTQNGSGVSQNAMEFLKNAQQASANTGGSGANSGAANAGEQGEQAQDGQQDGDDQESSTSASITMSSQGEASEESTEGASQNAMEFLKNARQASTNTGGSEANSGAAHDGQQGEQGEQAQDGQQASADTGDSESDPAEGENGQEGDQQQDGQQEANDQPPATSVAVNPSSPSESSTEGTDGTSQNALEYLTGENVQNDTNEAGTGATEGTLSIDDLLNAQGVDDSTTAIPLLTPPNGEPDTDPKASAKEKDG